MSHSIPGRVSDSGLNRLRSLLQIAEGALSVRQLMTTDPWCPAPDESSTGALLEMQRRRFDVAPVADDPVHRYVNRMDLLDTGQPVKDLAKPIDLSFLVTPEFSLAGAVAGLARRPFFFVFDGNQLSGLYTQADLQRPAVSMVLFGLVLAAESAINRMIERAYGSDAWVELLSEDRRVRLKSVYGDRRRTNTETSLIECAMLDDKLLILRKRADLCGSLGFQSGRAFHAWEEDLKRLRDTLAHGGGLLDTEREPAVAVELFDRVRGFAENCWDALRQLTGDHPSGG